jgi:hypothetical protein
MDPQSHGVVRRLRNAAVELGYPHEHLSDQQLLRCAGDLGQQCLVRGGGAAFVAAGLLGLRHSARAVLRR